MDKDLSTDLIPSFDESLYDPLIDLGVDFAEIGIDKIFDNEIVNQIPIAKTIVTGWKVGVAIRDRVLLRNTLVFINKFNSKTDFKKWQKHKEKLQSNKKFLENELERVLLLLERFLDAKKAVILAKFFNNYIEEKISWQEFSEVSDITDRIFLEDLKLLYDAYSNNGIDFNESYNYRIDRLTSLGLLENPQRLGKINMFSCGSADGLNEEELKDISITALGKLYCENGLLKTDGSIEVF